MSYVSIIVPHFNRSRMLAETLASVYAQTFQNWEVIIVDDGSDQQEWESIQRHGSEKVRVIQRKDGTKGPSSCRNIGAAIAQGEFLLFLDSDDFLAPHCLANRVKAMEHNCSADLGIFKMGLFYNVPGDSSEIYNKTIAKEDWIPAFISNENPWNVTCPLWKKEYFDRLGGFDERFLFMEDPEIHIRAINSGADIKCFYQLPVDTFYRINNIDESKVNFWRDSILYRILLFEKLTYNESVSKLLEKHPDFFKAGIYRLLRTFLYSRKNQFPDLYLRFNYLIINSKFFTFYEVKFITFLIELGNSRSYLARLFRLKGLCFRLLPEPRAFKQK